MPAAKKQIVAKTEGTVPATKAPATKKAVGSKVPTTKVPVVKKAVKSAPVSGEEVKVKKPQSTQISSSTFTHFAKKCGLRRVSREIIDKKCDELINRILSVMVPGILNITHAHGRKKIDEKDVAAYLENYGYRLGAGFARGSTDPKYSKITLKSKVKKNKEEEEEPVDPNAEPKKKKKSSADNLAKRSFFFYSNQSDRLIIPAAIFSRKLNLYVEQKTKFSKYARSIIHLIVEEILSGIFIDTNKIAKNRKPLKPNESNLNISIGVRPSDFDLAIDLSRCPFLH